MAQPQAYNREVDFTERDGDDTNHAGINAELDAAALSINQIRDNLALIQKDDGSLQNGIVGADQLAQSAFDAIKVDINEAVNDAQQAAASSTLAANTAIAARDDAQTAQTAAETAAAAALLNANTATTKAAEALASATSAATSASTATTKAAEASTSATNAATSATAAAGSATSAGTSATNAAASAASALASKNAAATSETNAAASASSALASLNEFKGRYYGPLANDPALDPLGNAPTAGDLYFNTGTNRLRVFNATTSTWNEGNAGSVAVQNFNGTGSQTVFTLAAAPESENNTQVYISGVYQQKDQYSISGTTLTFTSAPPAGTNNIEVVTLNTLPLGVTSDDLVQTAPEPGGLWLTVRGFITWMKGRWDALTGANGASLVGFTQAGTGAVARTVQDELRQRVSAKQFGAVGDGITDDTAALQAAINAAASGSKKLYLPAGTYKTTSGLSFGAPIRIFGDGADVASETGTVIKPTQSSGIALAFTNAAGSFDNGLILEDFAIIGTGSGTAVGLEVNGAVWTNSRIRNITVRSMGGRAVVINDCLTANFEHVRAQGCGSDGFHISGSNGIRLYGCMSESNAGYGYYFSSNLTAGERNGPLMLACHAEENTGGDAVYMNQYSNPMIQGCWLQVASASNVDRAAIHFDTCTGAMVSGNLLTSNATWASFQGVKLTGSLFCSIIGNNIDGFAAARAIVENSTSGSNIGFGNRGNGTQGAAGVTSSSTTGSVFHTHMGTGGSYGQEWTAGYHSFKNTAGTEVLAAGTDTLALGVSLSSTNARMAVKANAGKRAAIFQRSNGDSYCYFDNDNAVAGSPNGADAVLFFNKISASGRSINAAGTINASGADYAEYMVKRADCGAILKGQVCGVDENGMLTDRFDQAHSFVVKSTDPSYVGGDTWANAEVIGPRPELPVKQDSLNDDDYQNLVDAYESDLSAWKARIDAERQKVDRIAFAGQVPCIVSGSFKVGDYIVPTRAESGEIQAFAVEQPSFEQYRAAVGKVWATTGDKAWIAVKIG